MRNSIAENWNLAERANCAGPRTIAIAGGENSQNQCFLAARFFAGAFSAGCLAARALFAETALALFGVFTGAFFSLGAGAVFVADLAGTALLRAARVFSASAAFNSESNS